MTAQSRVFADSCYSQRVGQALNPTPRRALLTAHIVLSVGWIGAVAAFLAMNVVALTSSRSEIAGSMYIAMNVVGLYVIVPASILAVLTGVVQSIGTQWGVWRHRWVATKLVLGVLSMIALLLHQFTAVRTAAHHADGGMDPHAIGVQLVADASLAVVLLIVATILSVFKPWGLTRYGQRRRDETKPTEGLSLSAKLSIAAVIAVLATIVILHATGHAPHH
jgi:uncharacterized membrane protein